MEISAAEMKRSDTMTLLWDTLVSNITKWMQFNVLPFIILLSVLDIVGDLLYTFCLMEIFSCSLQVCEHRITEDQIFIVAVNILDRFLSVCHINKSQLQLTACVCLLLASKIRQCYFMGIECLAYYTEDSVTEEEIKVRDCDITRTSLKK